MVSSIPYRSFKEIDLRHSFGSLVLVVLILAVIIQEPRISLFAVGIIYSLSGPVEWAVRRITGRPLEKISDALAGEPIEE
jgi:CDP-diacylglycerol--serine O-phosphatidyltransferase